MHNHDHNNHEWLDAEYDEEADDYRPRNAPPRPRHSGRPPTGSQVAAYPRPRHQPRPRPGYRPVVVQSPPRAESDHVNRGEYLSIPKSAIAEIIPIVGQIGASFLKRPEPPAAVGNDVIDRDNATMHREALALHQQNQTRFLALSQLAGRLVKLFG